MEPVVVDPDRPVGGVGLLAAAERALVVGVERTGVPFPAGCLHELVAEQARVRADAVAVVARG